MYRFEPVGGLVALDFVNTVGWRDTDEPEERLASPEDLVEWGRAVGLLTTQEATPPAVSRRKRAGPEPLSRARAFREALYRLFEGFAAGRPPRPDDLGFLNRVLASAPSRRRLSAAGSRFSWGTTPKAAAPERLLWEVAWSAAKLLTEERPERLKRCDGEGCGWLFLDMSRNRTRRWCSMNDCGNRAKAKRHYARVKRS